MAVIREFMMTLLFKFRLARDMTSEEKMITSAYIYKKMERDNALLFAELWADLLRVNKKSA